MVDAITSHNILSSNGGPIEKDAGLQVTLVFERIAAQMIQELGPHTAEEGRLGSKITFIIDRVQNRLIEELDSATAIDERQSFLSDVRDELLQARELIDKSRSSSELQHIVHLIDVYLSQQGDFENFKVRFVELPAPHPGQIERV